MTTTEIKPPTGEGGGAYEQACHLKERARGFSALIGTAAEYGVSFDPSELEGVARLAEDIAVHAANVCETIRLEDLKRAVESGDVGAHALDALRAEPRGSR
jgi:hypothetical protein